jgi:chromate transporter
MQPPLTTVPFAQARRVWVRVACQSFGGPAGQVAVMHRILVEEKRWVSEARFLHALNYCMLLPGPEAQQLATYIGWLLNGTRGGLLAGTLFILPGFLAILALSLLYVALGHTPLVAGLFFGLKAAVLAIVVQAVLRIGKRALRNGALVAIAAAAFTALFIGGVPFPWIVAAALLIGLVGGKLRPELFTLAKHGNDAGGEVDLPGERVRPTAGRALRVLLAFGVLWGGALLLIAALFGREHVLFAEGLFFSKAAVLTFGGAYAVLAYLAQATVEDFGWLTAGEMLDGLGMAETTPGPLIQVVQFVGFLGAYRNPGELSPLAAALLGSLVTTWVTFVPCFLWIFLGAPYVETLRSQPRASAALAAVTAAVVGVILNLALWFALHTLFGHVEERHPFGLRLLVPSWESVHAPAWFLTALAFAGAFRFKLGMPSLLGGSALLGLIWTLAAG